MVRVAPFGLYKRLRDPGCWVPAVLSLTGCPEGASHPAPAGMATTQQGVQTPIPQHVPAPCEPADLSITVPAAPETGFSASWTCIFKQPRWSLCSPISSASRDSAHAGISVRVAIRPPNCQADIAATNLSPCLYTPLSLCQKLAGQVRYKCFHTYMFCLINHRCSDWLSSDLHRLAWCQYL